uniref:Uncharacterized protein n=2 Tax=Graphocephala atropunctata TaxID=36148 RepID=A0A1B6K8R5_9HEMI
MLCRWFLLQYAFLIFRLVCSEEKKVNVGNVILPDTLAGNNKSVSSRPSTEFNTSSSSSMDNQEFKKYVLENSGLYSSVETLNDGTPVSENSNSEPQVQH